VSGALAILVLVSQMMEDVLKRADIVRTFELMPEESYNPWLLRNFGTWLLLELRFHAALLLLGF
jgi:hypothetical protein